MKKALIFLVLVALLVCTAACGTKPTATTTGATTEAPTVGDSNAEVCRTLDALARKSYRSVSLSAVVVTKDATLPSTYQTTAESVSFSVTEVSRLPADEEFTDLPDGFLSTIEGTATVESGKITGITADREVSLPTYAILRGDFRFAVNNFRGLTLGEGGFAGDVVTPSAFLGGTAGVSNMKVSIAYTADAITAATVSYTKGEISVTLTYTFTL